MCADLDGENEDWLLAHVPMFSLPTWEVRGFQISSTMSSIQQQFMQTRIVAACYQSEANKIAEGTNLSVILCYGLNRFGVPSRNDNNSLSFSLVAANGGTHSFSQQSPCCGIDQRLFSDGLIFADSRNALISSRNHSSSQ